MAFYWWFGCRQNGIRDTSYRSRDTLFRPPRAGGWRGSEGDEQRRERSTLFREIPGQVTCDPACGDNDAYDPSCYYVPHSQQKHFRMVPHGGGPLLVERNAG